MRRKRTHLLPIISLFSLFPLCLLSYPSLPHSLIPSLSPQSDAATVKDKWTPISDGVLAKFTAEGKKLDWPGATAGVSVDRVSGDVRMVLSGQGLWQSADQGTTFTRIDGGSLGGRCETGFALNADPAGRRLACFMLDGSSAMTLDGGKTWSPFQQHGRGWDFGAADWSQAVPQTILALHHESGGELHLSVDGGKSWKLLGKDYAALGIFDSGTFVASKGDGILRSVDGGITWTKVSDVTPTSRTLCVFKGVGYWLTKGGLLVSHDKGVTWKQQGNALEAAWGPFFGKSEKQIVVVGRVGKEIGFYETQDAGETWKLAAPYPAFPPDNPPDWTPGKDHAAGWFINFGWDPKSNTFYASRMGHPTLEYRSIGL